MDISWDTLTQQTGVQDSFADYADAAIIVVSRLGGEMYDLPAPAGRNVYTNAVLQGRVTYKTLVTLDDNTYIVYSHATNSNNAEQTMREGKWPVADGALTADQAEALLG